MSVRPRGRAFLGVLAALFVAALAVVVLPARGSAATGITITSGPCSDGGTSFCFNPEAATATTGALVTWTDQSGVAHEIAQCTPSVCPGSPASTGSNTFDVAVPPDGHGSFTFSDPGTYYYYCTIHGYAAMHGTIVVSTPATPPPSPSATPKPTARPTARPTQGPAMQSATATPAGRPSTPAPRATPSMTPVPTVSATPNDAQPIGGVPSTPAPTPRITIASVRSSGSPALPVGVVIALVVCIGVATFVALRRRKRQAG